LYFKTDSIKEGKKENSIKKPFPKIIKIMNINDDKIIVVIASIEIERRIYILPIKNK
tara:strand:- start:456 stop:626 length:171 start_codon:yes stop_codon:yes gene_type:complete